MVNQPSSLEQAGWDALREMLGFGDTLEGEPVACSKPKPCSACPWVSKDPRDIEITSRPEMDAAMKAGKWFCCHVNMGTCHGAALRRAAHAKKETSIG